VRLAEALLDGIGGAFPRVDVEHVMADRHDVRIVGLEESHRLLDLVLDDVADGHLHARIAQQARGGEADAARAAGDVCHLAGELLQRCRLRVAGIRARVGGGVGRARATRPGDGRERRGGQREPAEELAAIERIRAGRGDRGIDGVPVFSLHLALVR
jgi:hypothetical protein